jgi:hypothetical protein
MGSYPSKRVEHSNARVKVYVILKLVNEKVRAKQDTCPAHRRDVGRGYTAQRISINLHHGTRQQRQWPLLQRFVLGCKH